MNQILPVLLVAVPVDRSVSTQQLPNRDVVDDDVVDDDNNPTNETFEGHTTTTTTTTTIITTTTTGSTSNGYLNDHTTEAVITTTVTATTTVQQEETAVCVWTNESDTDDADTDTDAEFLHNNSNTARLYSIVTITLANALHFGAYELARSAISALFTSTSIFPLSSLSSSSSTSSSSSSSYYYYSSTMIMTLAIGCVSPCSILCLTIHRRIFDQYGPQLALRYTTLLYAILLFMAAIIIRYGTGTTTTTTTTTTLNTTNTIETMMTTTVTDSNTSNHDQWKRCMTQCTIVVIFIMKNSFVQLLASQHWSFITGILTATTTTTSSRRRFQTNRLPVVNSDPSTTTIIAGIGSVVATFCGWMVAPFLHFVAQRSNHDNDSSSSSSSSSSSNGLTALLICAAVIMMIATICSDEAYRMAHKYHFAPTGTFQQSKKLTTFSTTKIPALSLYRRAQNLFQSVPVLYVLCYEVLISQGVSSLISYMFITYTKQSIPHDTERASHTGKVYGRINLCSGLLQFAILPFLLGRRRPHISIDRSVSVSTQENISNNNNTTTGTDNYQQQRQQRVVDWYWLFLPSVLCSAAIVMICMVESDATVVGTGGSSGTTTNRFDVVILSYSAMKVLEYSLRVALVERVYVPLNDNDRFLGKEIVGMIANRFGKSCSAILLAVATTMVPNFIHYAPMALLCLSFVWFFTSIRLIQLLQSKEKVE